MARTKSKEAKKNENRRLVNSSEFPYCYCRRRPGRVMVFECRSVQKLASSINSIWIQDAFRAQILTPAAALQIEYSVLQVNKSTTEGFMGIVLFFPNQQRFAQHEYTARIILNTLAC
ncbi:uncharacterized protein PV06_07874 [Exophiala oligosperma]|uniref:Uncharacterized protein n=1 Tax=Exophiala oligosperma TaxID=215243 RepID=A0A0D2BTB3_9EURO|nr:uncharacterized protein PV06_07874 [Exophiala oligosperma]KIW40697.1 hypothetical protein PV06_07874 [Exophiala oligosperma]